MRWRLLSWVGLGLLVLAIFLRLERVSPAAIEREALTTNNPITVKHASSGHLPGTHKETSRLAYRLSNTTKTISQLAQSQTGILLENALLDTAEPLSLSIPESLRAPIPSGSYIVQSRGPSTGAFRSRLARAGATVVSYIPNNAFLIRASDLQAHTLASQPEVQAVLPYEPYYKLKPSLLNLLLAPDATRNVEQLCMVNVLLFEDARKATMSAVGEMDLQARGEGSSPFGPVLTMRASLSDLAAIARLPGVQEIELAHKPAPANDLSRAALGTSVDSVSVENYLGLTGTNIVVNVNDTGVDANQADLHGRVLSDLPNGSSDTNGHGTHVAGIIAGSGVQSLTATNAPGSSMPPASLQFRGKAPAAKLFSIAVDLDGTAPGSEIYLQQTAARTNAFISNNSWLYAGDTDYDLAAASFDAAARDALPGISGSQPLLLIFPAGNHGGAGNNGAGGIPGTIQSPATAKNVITVGAIEQPRFITNETWTCTTNGTVTCQTNTPWLPLTDSSNQVAGFSARGNVGSGVEGEAGRFKPDVVAPGTFILSTRSSQWNQTAYYTQTNNAITATPDANYFEVLSNLNDSLGPFYQFESGTSMAAADVSGLLALVQDFFQNRLSKTNSAPARW
jgi:subtilisin family serine protease